MEQLTLVNAGARSQCSNRRRVSNKRRVSIKRRGFEVHVLINAGAFIRSFTVFSRLALWPQVTIFTVYRLMPVYKLYFAMAVQHKHTKQETKNDYVHLHSQEIGQEPPELGCTVRAQGQRLHHGTCTSPVEVVSRSLCPRIRTTRLT